MNIGDFQVAQMEKVKGERDRLKNENKVMERGLKAISEGSLGHCVSLESVAKEYLAKVEKIRWDQ